MMRRIKFLLLLLWDKVTGDGRRRIHLRLDDRELEKRYFLNEIEIDQQQYQRVLKAVQSDLEKLIPKDE